MKEKLKKLRSHKRIFFIVWIIGLVVGIAFFDKKETEIMDATDNNGECIETSSGCMEVII